MTVEILAGYGIGKALKHFGIKAKRTYKRKYQNPYDIEYEVWEMTDKDLRLLNSAIDWPESWGFWRYDTGSNMGPVHADVIINAQPLRAWKWFNKEDDFNTYHDLLDYFETELGASSEKNVCSLAVDLAKQNGMKMSELFQKYYG